MNSLNGNGQARSGGELELGSPVWEGVEKWFQLSFWQIWNPERLSA